MRPPVIRVERDSVARQMPGVRMARDGVGHIIKNCGFCHLLTES